MVLYNLNSEELGLIDDLKEIGFGTLLDVEIVKGDEKPTTEALITREQRDLVEMIRNGTNFFQTIKIQSSSPVFIEVPTITKHGRRAIKTYKFN